MLIFHLPYNVYHVHTLISNWNFYVKTSWQSISWRCLHGSCVLVVVTLIYVLVVICFHSCYYIGYLLFVSCYLWGLILNSVNLLCSDTSIKEELKCHPIIRSLQLGRHVEKFCSYSALVRWFRNLDSLETMSFCKTNETRTLLFVDWEYRLWKAAV